MSENSIPEPLSEIATHDDFLMAIERRSSSSPMPQYPIGELGSLYATELRELVHIYERGNYVATGEYEAEPFPEAMGYHIAGQRNGRTLSALWGSAHFNGLSERAIRRIWNNPSLHKDLYCNDGYLAIAQANNTPRDVLEGVEQRALYADVTAAARAAITAKAGA